MGLWDWIKGWFVKKRMGKTFLDTENDLKGRLHTLADNLKIVKESNKVFDYPVASEELIKLKNQLEHTVRVVDEQIGIIQKYWENKDKFYLRQQLEEIQNFEMFYEDHGWGDKWIKVRFHNPSCDLLLEQKGDQIEYHCMCLGEKGGVIHKKELSELITRYSKHGCIPWPG